MSIKPQQLCKQKCSKPKTQIQGKKKTYAWPKSSIKENPDGNTQSKPRNTMTQLKSFITDPRNPTMLHNGPHFKTHQPRFQSKNLQDSNFLLSLWIFLCFHSDSHNSRSKIKSFFKNLDLRLVPTKSNQLSIIKLIEKYVCRIQILI